MSENLKNFENLKEKSQNSTLCYTEVRFASFFFDGFITAIELNSIVNQKCHPEVWKVYCIEILENLHCELLWPHGPPQRVTWLAFAKQATNPTEPLNVNCFQTLLCKPWIIFKNELLCVAYCVHFQNYKSKQTIECQINQELSLFSKIQ